MSDKAWSKEWFDKANSDLAVAEYLLNMHPVPVEIICYHCAQAAEKFLKGALVCFDVEPPKTHDLVLLCKRCCDADEHFEELVDSCVELTPYGVQVRYPSDLELDESDMRCALRECKKICDYVRQHFAQ